jgi:hypothetical protein
MDRVKQGAIGINASQRGYRVASSSVGRAKLGPRPRASVPARRNWRACPAFDGMFFFYSNGVGLAGSIIASLLLSAVLLYACSGP